MFGSKPTVQIVFRSLKNIAKDYARFMLSICQTLEPFSCWPKELVKDWRNRGVWEEMGLIEFADLNPSVGSHAKVDVLTSIQKILLSALGQSYF